MYKSGLFLTAGAVEKQAGTADLSRLGGLGRRMPVTFACFLITAASISGVPPLNGFFSKELVYDGALERHIVFYLAAVLGSFFTAASFLKLGHAAYLGRLAPAHAKVKEAPAGMLTPMVLIAAMCVLFGLWNALPLHHLIQPILGESRLEGHDFAGLPANSALVLVTVAVLVAALINHIFGVKAAGSGLGAADHVHHAPGLGSIYRRAEKGAFDPYNWGVRIADVVAGIAWSVDRGIDRIYDMWTVAAAGSLTKGIRAVHNGDCPRYILWSLAGALVVLVWLVR
jgi:NADH-quinone oxidoreductase subunit L